VEYCLSQVKEKISFRFIKNISTLKNVSILDTETNIFVFTGAGYTHHCILDKPSLE
jgi:hypothetical protein